MAGELCANWTKAAALDSLWARETPDTPKARDGQAVRRSENREIHHRVIAHQYELFRPSRVEDLQGR